MEVDLVLEPMTVHCAGCGHGGPVTDHLAVVACRRCGAVDVEVTGSDDVVLESITVAAEAKRPQPEAKRPQTKQSQAEGRTRE
ncbi:hypothetical protein ACFQ1L_19040 [Phytohabitans flavus]|uniref:hypothetical protein n=1 Tax=Phytohabitans flavus TaxID=1076124 RepID=UPI00363876C8